MLSLYQCFKPKDACAVKPEVLKSWTLIVDYSRAPCFGADQKTRGLLERDWARAGANGLGTITNLEKMAAFLKSFVWCPLYGEKVEPH